MACKRTSFIKRRAFGAASVIALAIVITTTAHTQDAGSKTFNIEAQPLSTALLEFSRQSQVNVIAPSSVTRGLISRPVSGDLTPQEALEAMLGDTSLDIQVQPNGAIVLSQLVTDARDGSFRVAQTDTGSARSVGIADRDMDDGEEKKPDEIVVTGTNVRGAKTGSPLITFDKTDIDASGFASVQQFLRSIPQNSGAGVTDEGSFGGSVGGTSSTEFGAGVNLRGLGNNSTLTLLNGRRISAAGTGNYIDVSMIPLSAVERIEVLTDGASAIYGSDAVGGVVNIILRKGYDGAETRLRYGTVTEGKSDEIRFGQTFGRDWNSGNGVITYEYYKRGSLDSEDREFTVDATDPTTLLPEQERHSVLATVSQTLYDNIELFATGLYSDRSFDFIISSGPFVLPSVGDTQQLSGTAGLKFDIGRSWQSDAAVTYSSTNTQTLRDIVGLANVRNQDNKNSSLSFDVKADGPLIELPGGELLVALGGQFRTEELDLFTETNGTASSSNLSSDRDVYSVFGEVFIPLVGESARISGIHALEFSAAVRYEDYSDVGSTTNPKFGVRWEAVSGVNFRGTYGTSFRAPLLTQLDDSGFRVFAANLTDPALGPTPSLVLFGNNSELQPEEAKTWTIGFDISDAIISGFDISATYYDISYDQRIAQAAPGAAFFNLLSDPQFAPVVTRNPDLALVTMLLNEPNLTNTPGFVASDILAVGDNRLSNLSSTEVSGLDVQLGYGVDSDVGRLDFRLNGNYIFEFVNQLTTSSSATDVVDTVFNPADLRIRGSASWANNGFSSTISVNHTGGYVNNIVGREGTIDAWTTVDVQMAYIFDEQSSSFFLGGTTVSLSVQNIFNQDPPFVDTGASGLNYDAVNASVLGRFVAFQITKAW